MRRADDKPWIALLIHDLRMREAEASVRLDEESAVHTCHSECQNPKCVERRAQEARSNAKGQA